MNPRMVLAFAKSSSGTCLVLQPVPASREEAYLKTKNLSFNCKSKVLPDSEKSIYETPFRSDNRIPMHSEARTLVNVSKNLGHFRVISPCSDSYHNG